MAHPALEKAVSIRNEMAEKIAAAEEKIKEWRSRMGQAERFIRDWQDFSGEPTPILPPPVLLAAPPSAARRASRKNPKKEDVAKEARKILIEFGRPMSRDELFAILRERGVEIHGQNPPVVFQTMLWRMQNVVIHLKGHGYWPTDIAYEEAGYFPEAPSAGDTDDSE